MANVCPPNTLTRKPNLLGKVHADTNGMPRRIVLKTVVGVHNNHYVINENAIRIDGDRWDLHLSPSICIKTTDKTKQVRKLLFFAAIVAVAIVYASCNCERIVQSYKNGDVILIYSKGDSDLHGTVQGKPDWKNNYRILGNNGIVYHFSVRYLDSLNDSYN